MYGKVNDILLLSQSFDDTANYEHFLPSEGTMLLDWIIRGDDEVSFYSVTMYFASNLRGSGPTYWACNTSRKAAFAYGTRLIRDGETGELTTIGPGGRRNDPPGVGTTTRLSHFRNCKDVMISVVVNRMTVEEEI